MIRLGLAGDTMLGRKVGERLAVDSPASLFGPSLVEAAREADLFVLNLECCVSDRGERWPDPGKPFFFRAPPVAVEALTLLRVDAVTLANNHALDYGADALLDTIDHLHAAGIACTGAGPDLDAARAPAVVEHERLRLAVVGLTDHPADFAAGRGRPGVAFADLRRRRVPAWVTSTVRACAARGEAVLVTPHWGRNWAEAPIPRARRVAPALLGAGATLVAGHSPHVFQGAGERVLYALGDFLDDYAVRPEFRNDLGLLWLVDLDADGPARVEAVPLKLEYCHTRLADGGDAAWIARRFVSACEALGVEAREQNGRLVVDWR